MKTLYQKFAGWLWVAERHYWLPIMWALVSFVVVNQPRVAEATWHRLIPTVIAAAFVFPGGIAGLAIAIILIAAVAAIVFIALRQMGVAIPPWVIQVFWVLVVAFVCIAAIRFLLSM